MVSCNERKNAKIKEILDRGSDVAVEIVAEYDKESDAYEHEMELISASPTLTNVAPGGIPLKLLSPEQARRQAKARQKRLEVAILESNKTRVAAGHKRREKYLSVPGGDVHETEIREWLCGLEPIKYGFEADPALGREKPKKRGSIRHRTAPAQLARRKRLIIDRAAWRGSEI